MVCKIEITKSKLANQENGLSVLRLSQKYQKNSKNHNNKKNSIPRDRMLLEL